jgi:ABC-type transport system involved in multi-copper enzyme maturation permease subunit
MSWPVQVGALLLVALIEAVLIGSRWRRLCGPVLFYDMVRTARQGRYALIRLVYGIILFAALNLMAAEWLNRRVVNARDVASFANAFFATLVMIQFTVIIVMTPAYTAGAITEEKERKTLEYLLATDLSSREIVLGKFFSRLGNLTLLLMTGFPIVALLQLLGGIDPDLLLMTLAATLLLMTSLASVSVLCSVYARRTRMAVVATYAGLVVYLIFFPMLYGLLRVSSYRGMPVAGPQAAFMDAFDFINCGNPFYAFGRITGGPGRSVIHELAGSLGRFALIHLSVTVLCLGWAMLRLRGVFLKVSAHPRGRRAATRKSRVIGDRPMVWKEMQPGKRSYVTRTLVAILVLLTLAPVPFIFSEAGMSSAAYWRPHLAQSYNFYLRSVGTLVACGLLLCITLRTSGTVTIEREKQTLDALLTTPLSTTEILHGKWLGSILAFGRIGPLWLGALWMLGLATGGLSGGGLVLLVLVLAVFSPVCSAIGLWASTITRSSMRAHMTALGTAALLALGHWILAPLLAVSGGRLVVAYGKFATLSLTPPIMIAFAAFSETEMLHGPGSDGATLLGLLFVGLFIWSGVGALFYRMAYNSFRERALQHVIVIPARQGLDNHQFSPCLDGEKAASCDAQEADRPGDVDRHVR